MARRAALLMRWLLSLVLIVAAMPLRASAPPCPASPAKKAPAKKAPAECGMPCCAKARVETPAVEMACCKARKAVASLGDPCRCELKASFTTPAIESKATLPSFEGPLVALTEAVPTLASVVLMQGEPGVFGTDSGPPLTPPTDSDASRAPPVDRA